MIINAIVMSISMSEKPPGPDAGTPRISQPPSHPVHPFCSGILMLNP
jgi:hypothetical protein